MEEKKEERRAFVIDRARWQCKGHTTGATRLLNEHGKMCCFGFHALSLGYSEEQILGMATPIRLATLEGIKPGLPVVNTEEKIFGMMWVAAALIANDGIKDDAKREQAIARVFAEHGFDVTYTGEYPLYNA